ncbi:MAG: hypothetical protein C4293_14395 [Nitrospiraceae bacterium]
MAGSRVPLFRFANIVSDFRMQGWALSLLLHLSAVSIVVLFLTEIKPPLEKQPFRWEVSFVEPPAPQPAAAPSSQSKRPPDVMAHRLKSASIVRTVQPEMKSLVAVQQKWHQPVEQRLIDQKRIETKQLVEVPTKAEATEVISRPVEKPIHKTAVREKQTPVNHETAQERRVVENEAVDAAQPMQQAAPVQSREPVSSAVKETVSAQKELSTVTASQRTEAAPLVKEAIAAPHVEERAFAHEIHELPVQQAVVTEAQPALSTRPPLVARTKPTQHTSPLASVHEQDATQSAHEQPAAVTTPTQSVPAPRPDYGWHALRRKIEQLKRYPSKARLNRWEGTVVVRAVIGENGHCSELTMERSSGYDELDQAALELLRRAFPISLQYELGKPEVTIRIPVTYKLE